MHARSPSHRVGNARCRTLPLCARSFVGDLRGPAASTRLTSPCPQLRYLQHSGGNWGFICLLVAHKLKGYGLAVMTNSFGGGELIGEIKARVERAYGWDSLDKEVTL